MGAYMYAEERDASAWQCADTLSLICMENDKAH